MDTRTREPLVRVWALVGARAGDNDQVIALAEALQVPFEIKRLEYGALQLLGPRLLGTSLISLSRRSRDEILSEPPPDLTISAGHRSVALVQSLRRRSGGRTRSIHVGFPRISPGRFDLVIATPQYPIADHPNLLRTPYALTRAAKLDVDAKADASLAALPRPIRLLLVGGRSLYWTVKGRAVLDALGEMLASARTSGGSVLVTSSPRTPASLRRRIGEILKESDVPSLLASPGRPPPYANLLAAADSILVTADSVAMVSDAIWTGKPVALIKVDKTPLGRVAMTIGDLLQPGRPVYPQDLRCFWDALRAIGITEKLSLPRASPSDELERVLSRVRPILRELRLSARA